MATAVTHRGNRNARREGGRGRGGARRDGKEMSDNEIAGFLARKIEQAMNDEDGDLSDVRQENFNYYIGAEYGDEREGYSKFVTRETFEAVEWAMPSVLRVFLSGDNIVSFDPEGPEDEAEAKQETDIVQHFVMKANGSDGFVALHHWLKDCLMNPTGYVKVAIEEFKTTDVGRVTGLDEMGLAMITEDENVTVIEQTTRIVGGMQLYDLKVRTVEDVKQLTIYPTPPEECLVDNDCTSTNLDKADFVCHRVQKTYTRLVEEGYDPDMLDQVGNEEGGTWNDERVNRLFYEDEDPDATDEDDSSMRQFWVHECYAYFDYDGDGIAEFRRVDMIGHLVFKNEETNYQPFVAMSAILMPHKHNGMGYIEIVKDLQLLMSILTRQMLDNIYDINVGKMTFSENALTPDGATMEALLNTQARYIPVRGRAVDAFAPKPHVSIIGDILPVIQHVKTQQSTRSGVSPETTLDGNSLQEVRQDVFANALDRASQRIEMLVRIFAETGFKQLALKAHQLLRSHWDIEQTVKLRGKWVPVDPSGWRKRTNLSVNVGLGFATRPQLMQVLIQLVSMQKEAIQYGMTDPKRIYRALDKLVRASNIGGDGNMYFIDPESEEFVPPESKPSPQDELALAQANALGQEQKRKMQELQFDMKTEGPQKQMEMRTKLAELELRKSEAALKQRELVLKEQEMVRDGTLKEGEVSARIKNIDADTSLKRAQADKSMADAASVAVEASDVYRDAVKMVAGSGELNDGAGGLEYEVTYGDDDDDEDSDDGPQSE